jgi:hypothetical protein
MFIKTVDKNFHKNKKKSKRNFGKGLSNDAKPACLSKDIKQHVGKTIYLTRKSEIIEIYTTNSRRKRYRSFAVFTEKKKSDINKHNYVVVSKAI